MELSDILAEDAVLYCPGVKSKQQLLELLSTRAGKLFRQDPELVLEALANREALGSTGLGDGIAIPHGKLPGLQRVVGVFARVEPGIDFEAVDDQPVDLVLALLAPIGAGAEHLKALSRVARALREEPVVEELRRTDDPERLHAILTSHKAAHKAA
jgi:PTS system nitrogen regulatory IIA component